MPYTYVSWVRTIIKTGYATKVSEAAEAFYDANTVEEEPGKFRCPLSGKLFRDPVFVRKHIDNKHSADALKARARPLGRRLTDTRRRC